MCQVPRQSAARSARAQCSVVTHSQTVTQQSVSPVAAGAGGAPRSVHLIIYTHTSVTVSHMLSQQLVVDRVSYASENLVVVCVLRNAPVLRFAPLLRFCNGFALDRTRRALGLAALRCFGCQCLGLSIVLRPRCSAGHSTLVEDEDASKGDEAYPRPPSTDHPCRLHDTTVDSEQQRTLGRRCVGGGG